MNPLASKQARADRNDALAAAQVGTPDIRAWLLSRYERGVTLRGLATQVNRSIPWVRSRLADSPAQREAGDGDGEGPGPSVEPESGPRDPGLESGVPGQISLAWGQTLTYGRSPRVLTGRRLDDRRR